LITADNLFVEFAVEEVVFVLVEFVVELDDDDLVFIVD
jgi:hypothetical protein